MLAVHLVLTRFRVMQEPMFELKERREGGRSLFPLLDQGRYSLTALN